MLNESYNNTCYGPDIMMNESYNSTLGKLLEHVPHLHVPEGDEGTTPP
jgi:hypothetical protein